MKIVSTESALTKASLQKQSLIARGTFETSPAIFDNQLLTYKQTAQYLSLSEPYLRKLKAREEIPYVVVGSRAVRFRVSSLNQWIENREVK